MLRRLLMFVSAVSLLLCIATCVLWVRSYWFADLIGYGRWTLEHEAPKGWYRAQPRTAKSSQGMVLLSTHFLWLAPEVFDAEKKTLLWDENGRVFYDSALIDDERPFRAADPAVNGFGSREEDRGFRSYIWFPHWAVAAVFGVLPMIVVIRRRIRTLKARAGLCPACGYDLRATPDRCPECGAGAGSGGAM